MSLHFPFKKSSPTASDSTGKSVTNNEFIDAINLFKSQRQKTGITLEKLSKETKISRNVLLAIEKGLKEYLPEKTYLNSMIKSLENKLNLEKGSLNGLSEKKIAINTISRFKFNFINIDFLDSWIGSLMYLICMLSSILVLNSQQKYLIQINSVSVEPITIEKTGSENEFNKQKEK